MPFLARLASNYTTYRMNTIAPDDVNRTRVRLRPRTSSLANSVW